MLLALFSFSVQPSLGAESPEDTRSSGPSSLLVLGTPHLSSIDGGFKAPLLDSLIERLVAFGPDVVMIEALPPRSLAKLQAQGGYADDVLDSFGKRMTRPGTLAQETLDVAWSEAWQRTRDTQGECEPGVSAAACILLYLAAYEFDTALLKYRRLDDEQRSTFSEQYPGIASDFDASQESSNEYYTIAQRLADELSLPRIFPVDAHEDKIPFLGILAEEKGIEEYFQRVFGDVSQLPFVRESEQRQARAIAAGDLLPYYRWLNAPDALAWDRASQWQPFFDLDDASNFGKRRLALWEMRNFLTAANIARVLADFPGQKAVFIVGSSHKPFIDGYFADSIWVEVVSAGSVLGEPSRSNR